MICMVSGSHGFIGGHLVWELKEKGHEVRTYDRDKVNDFTGVDVVFHMAGLNNMGDIPFTEYFDANISLTVKILEESKNAGVKKFIFPATTANMYKNTYAFTKKLAEYICLFYNQNYGLYAICIGLPKVTQENIDETVKSIIKQAL